MIRVNAAWLAESLDMRGGVTRPWREWSVYLEKRALISLGTVPRGIERGIRALFR